MCLANKLGKQTSQKEETEQIVATLYSVTKTEGIISVSIIQPCGNCEVLQVSEDPAETVLSVPAEDNQCGFVKL